MNFNNKILDYNDVMHEQINRVLKYFGEQPQRIKACEELAELQCEIFHYDSKKCETYTYIYNKIIEEIADVYVMLEQIARIYNISKEKIVRKMSKKLRRTEDLIDGAIGG